MASSTASPPVPAQTGTSLVDRLGDVLLTAIVRGEIPPGARINEPALARRYAVSRGPLREAIRRLEGLHLLRRIPNAGVRVVTLDARETGELYELREALEGMAARLAARNMTGPEIAELRQLLDDHAGTIADASGSEYFQQEGDFDFHFRVIRGSGNARLIEALCGEVYHLLRMFRYRSSQAHTRSGHALREHHAIVDAIEQRDEELAEMLMRRHVSAARRAMEAASPRAEEPS